MAFGKSTETKRIKNMILDDQLWRTLIESEEKANQSWKSRWNWILDEYDELHKKLQEVSNRSEFLSDVNKVFKDADKRSIKPIPNSTNHEYGWILSRPDFQIEKYGPDVEKGVPLPDLYHIVK